MGGSIPRFNDSHTWEEVSNVWLLMIKHQEELEGVGMSNHIGEITRVVVCAANRFENTIICGARHFDDVMSASILNFYASQSLSKENIPNHSMDWEQGFIDQWGIFMNRKEAFEVAKNTGQINTRRKKSWPLDLLFSEDLY